jgi:hypothetical protein
MSNILIDNVLSNAKFLEPTQNINIYITGITVTGSFSSSYNFDGMLDETPLTSYLNNQTYFGDFRFSYCTLSLNVR